MYPVGARITGVDTEWMRVRYAVTALLTIFVTSGCTGPDGKDPAPTLPTVGSAGGWRTLDPAPSQRTEVAAAAAGTRIAVTGGYRADGATVSTVEILETATGRWEPGPSLPVPVNHAMSVGIADRIYVFGGYLSGNRPTDAAFVLDATQGWRRIAPMPQARAAATAVAVDGTVYVAAGVGPSGLAAEMLVYDTATDRWTVAPGPPTRREHLGGAGFGGLVYTVGGRTGGLDTNLGAFEAFDPRTGRWTRLPDLPTPRGGLAATATCAGLIVAVGGEARATFAEAEVFDTATETWKTLPPLPTPRHGLGVVAIRNTIYTLAGGPTPGLHVADTTEAIEAGGVCQ
jgi:non-specific serine/threonine protein kinase